MMRDSQREFGSGTKYQERELSVRWNAHIALKLKS
jgi:hypothetical protein